MRISKVALPLFPLLMLSGVLFSCSVVADEDKSPLIASVTLGPQTPPPLKSKTLAGKVQEAIEHIAKADDSSWLSYLQEQHEKEPDVVLSLLKPFLKHPTAKVRRALTDAAYSRGTRTAFEIMATLCSDPDYSIRSLAAGLLQNEYSHQQIVEWGGKKLHSGLVWAFLHDPYGESREVALLIGLFGDQRDAPMLSRRLHTVQKDKDALYDDAICLDLSLCRLGDKEANQRLIQSFESKDKGQLMALLGRLRWFPNQELFSRALELLNHKQTVMDTIPSAPNSDVVVPNSRVCDIAFANFWRIFPIGELKVKRSAPWPDEQRNAASQIWQKEIPNFVARSRKVQWLKPFNDAQSSSR